MWTDTYCYISQCMPGAGPEVGSKLFPPEEDHAFSRSVGGMIWPRGFVGAAAFWNYDASVDPASSAFVSNINSITTELEARGAYVCPVDCACNQVSACGHPYIDPAPALGMSASMKQCADYDTQRWILQDDGHLALSSNSSLCLTLPTSPDAYPAVVALCSLSSTTTFEHSPHSGTFQSKTATQCLDLEESTGRVGGWVCGSVQPNQEWSYDPTTLWITSLSNYGDDQRDKYAGMCVTVS
jgi:hypothetical protein